MVTDDIRYVSYREAVFIHVELMRLMGETRYGVDDRTLIESALARPQHAARTPTLSAKPSLSILRSAKSSIASYKRPSGSATAYPLRSRNTNVAINPARLLPSMNGWFCAR